jgi:hypothetical protein
MNFELPGANRRFYLPHTSHQKWCHPEFILPDNFAIFPQLEKDE